MGGWLGPQYWVRPEPPRWEEAVLGRSLSQPPRNPHANHTHNIHHIRHVGENESQGQNQEGVKKIYSIQNLEDNTVKNISFVDKKLQYIGEKMSELKTGIKIWVQGEVQYAQMGK